MSTPIQGTSVRLSGVSVESVTFDDGDGDKIVARSLVQVARFGEYKGHPQGEFVFDAEAFAQITSNFTRLHMAGAVPFDHNHSSELPSPYPDMGDHAVGWIMALYDRGEGGLWAAVDWVDAVAVAKIRAKQLKFVSPAVTFRAIDRESGDDIGAVLTSAALTNRPFLLGMAEVTATDRQPLDGMAPLTASEPAAHALGLAPGEVHIPTGAAIAPPTEPAMSDEKTDNDVKKAMMGDAPPMGAPPAMMNPKLAAMAPGLGMGAEATEDALLDKLAEVVAQLQATQQAEAATMADAVCASGRVPREGHADLIALCLSDRTRFDRLFPAQAAAPAAPTGDVKTLLTERLSEPRQHPQPVAETDDSDPLAESKEAHALALKMLSDKRAPDYGTAIQMASREVRKHRTDAALSRLASATR